jgi:hypothetical protein
MDKLYTKNEFIEIHFYIKKVDCIKIEITFYVDTAYSFIIILLRLIWTK